MYQNGVDIRTLQSILGHSSVDTTMIYTHIENENIAKLRQGYAGGNPAER